MLGDHLLYLTTHYNHLESALDVPDYPLLQLVSHKPSLPSRLQVNLPDNLRQPQHHTVLLSSEYLFETRGTRSEERRVGKEWSCRRRQVQLEKERADKCEKNV